jgi:hypothetical protein
LDQLVETIRRHLQDVLYVAATCLPRSNCVDALSKRNFSRSFLKFNYDFHFRIKSVHVKGLMILRIGDKSNRTEPTLLRYPDWGDTRWDSTTAEHQWSI